MPNWHYPAGWAGAEIVVGAIAWGSLRGSWRVTSLVVLTALALACSGGGTSPTGAPRSRAASQPAGASRGEPTRRRPARGGQRGGAAQHDPLRRGTADAHAERHQDGLGALLQVPGPAAWRAELRPGRRPRTGRDLGRHVRGRSTWPGWDPGATCSRTTKWARRPSRPPSTTRNPSTTPSSSVSPGKPSGNSPRTPVASASPLPTSARRPGWLIPTAWFKKQGIDPQQYFQYSEGATHAANEIAVAEKQVDLATDFDRNRTAMIEGGSFRPTPRRSSGSPTPCPMTRSRSARGSIRAGGADPYRPPGDHARTGQGDPPEPLHGLRHRRSPGVRLDRGGGVLVGRLQKQ